LLHFNRSAKVDHSSIVNASGTYAFAMGTVVIRPQVYVENLFDRADARGGPFFSG